MKINPAIAMFARYASAAHVGLYRLSGGAGLFNRNVCVLTTRGRRSGREISKPLLYLKREDKLYMVASFAGSDQPPAWYLNLLEHPEATVELGADKRKYRTRTLAKAEKAQVWPDLLKIWPAYATYQARTTRDIPVIEFVVQPGPSAAR